MITLSNGKRVASNYEEATAENIEAFCNELGWLDEDFEWKDQVKRDAAEYCKLYTRWLKDQGKKSRYYENSELTINDVGGKAIDYYNGVKAHYQLQWMRQYYEKVN